MVGSNMVILYMQPQEIVAVKDLTNATV